MEALARRLKRHLHAPTHTWFAPCAPGLEPVLAAELRRLGGEPEVEPGGVAFRGRLELMYRAQLMLFTANRIWLRLGTVGARRPEELFRHLVRWPWELYLAPDIPLRISSHAQASWLHHTELIEATVRDAIARRLAEQGATDVPARQVGTPEAEEAGRPIQRLMLRLEENRAELSLDATGPHLHRRGYRQAPGRAPLRETLASGVLLLAGYDGRGPLVDPMCGAGTLAIEAACMATGRPPGAARAFLFQRWPSYREATWGHLLERARAAEHPAPAPVVARDCDPAQLRAARANLELAGLQQVVALEEADFFVVPPGVEPGWVVMNPPYGVRLEAERELYGLYRRIGERLSVAYRGWRLGLVAPAPELVSALGLPGLARTRLPHGGLVIEVVTGVVG